MYLYIQYCVIKTRIYSLYIIIYKLIGKIINHHSTPKIVFTSKCSCTQMSRAHVLAYPHQHYII